MAYDDMRLHRDPPEPARPTMPPESPRTSDLVIAYQVLFQVTRGLMQLAKSEATRERLREVMLDVADQLAAALQPKDLTLTKTTLRHAITAGIAAETESR